MELRGYQSDLINNIRAEIAAHKKRICAVLGCGGGKSVIQGKIAAEAAKKKKTDFSTVEFLSIDEGLCVQCMHVGAYDDEPATVTRMHRFAEEHGYALDFSAQRLHHEIYLSDARKVAPEKWKTVIRHPIKKI